MLAEHKKGQASLEQLVVTGLGIAFIALIFVIAFNYATDSIRISQAQDAVNKIARAANHVYSLGPGSKEKVYVYMPDGFEYTEASGNRILIRIRLSSGTADIFAVTYTNLTGVLPDSPGTQEISVMYLESGKVFVGDTYLSCSPSSITKTFIRGESQTDAFTITNIGENTMTGIIASMRGSLGDLVSITQPSPTLSPGGSDTVDLSFSIPSDKRPGIYMGSILVDADNNSQCTVATTLFVTANGSDGEDASGPVVISLEHTPVNASEYDYITIRGVADDSETGGSIITSCELDLDYSGIWNSMDATDGMFNQVTENITYSLGKLELGSHTVRVRCTDSTSKTGPITLYTFVVGTLGREDNAGPIVIDMNHTEYPTAMSNITVGGTATDEYTGNSTIESCRIKIDSGNWTAMSAIDGTWNSSVETFSYNIGTMPVGSHTVYYQCTDSAGNMGSIYEDSFIVVDVDLMLVLDRSGSMAYYVTNSTNENIVSTTSTSWTLVKSLTVSQKNGNSANLVVETRTGSGGCTVLYNATISGITVATGSRTSTSYGAATSIINITNQTAPYQVDLWIKRSGGSCTVYNRVLSVWQPPTKMDAVKNSSKSFLDVAGNNIQAGLVSYSTSATTDKTLAMMTPTNQQLLKNAIDAISPTGSTCIQCGLQNAANELVSVRARPGATKAVVLLTDGQANVGDSVAGAVYCRERNVTVYTIGFGYDVDETELTNIAMLTNGEYYFAPDVETLQEIFNRLGRVFKSVSR